MGNHKILYVSQEIIPYLPETQISTLCRTLSQTMQERGNEIRTFMPRYGLINERRNQLHEVIRLSGMNLIIDDNDHQLIIKVASIPTARIQVYFIDNEDYFSRKAVLTDEDGNQFADNDERAIFFSRGVLETVKKLRWQPDIVHCHGNISSMIPMHLRNMFADDPLFRDVKIVSTIYGDQFDGTWDDKFAAKLLSEGVEPEDSKIVDNPTCQNLTKFIIRYADGIVLETNSLDPEVEEYLKQSGKPVLPYFEDKTTKEYLDKYQTFYDELL